MAGIRSRLIDVDQVGVFMLVSRWPKRCLALSKAETRGGGFGLPVQRTGRSPVMLAASIAASRLLWMMANAPA